MGTLVPVPAVLLPVRFPVNEPGKAAEDGAGPWAPESMLETWKKLQAPECGQVSLATVSIWGANQKMEAPLSLPVTLISKGLDLSTVQ